METFNVSFVDLSKNNHMSNNGGKSNIGVISKWFQCVAVKTF